MPGGNKKVTYTKTNLRLKAAGLFKCVTFLLPPVIKRVNKFARTLLFNDQVERSAELILGIYETELKTHRSFRSYMKDPYLLNKTHETKSSVFTFKAQNNRFKNVEANFFRNINISPN